MPDADLAALREHVLADPELFDRLLGEQDRRAAEAAILAAAAGLGLDVRPDELAEAVASARRTWLERWV